MRKENIKSNRGFRKYPQTVMLQCGCCQQVYYALVYFEANGIAEYRCDCGHLNRIKLL